MTDEQTAAELCKWLEPSAEPAGMSGAFWRAAGPRGAKRSDAAVDIETHKAAIVRALQQARIEALDTHANAAVLRMCHEARMCNGIVDYSDPNATGVVRRVVTKSIGPIAYPTGDYVHVLRVEASWEEMSKAAESAKEAKK